MLKGMRRELGAPQKNILDGDLLFEYFNMGFVERSEIAKKIKTNMEQVSFLILIHLFSIVIHTDYSFKLLDDLTEIFQLTSHF